MLGVPELRSWPSDDTELPLPNRAGSFLVDCDSLTRDGEWLMWWDFGDPRMANRKDPHLLLASLLAPSEQQVSDRAGGFRILDGARGDIEVALRFHPRARDADIFRRYHASARLPWSYAATVLDQPARDLYFAEHVQPLPPSWVAEIVENLVGARAERLLEQWSQAAAGAARLSAGESISALLNLWVLRPGGLVDPHRAALCTRIRAALASTRKTMDGETKSFADWYATVAAEIHDQPPLREKNPSLLPFTRLGFQPSERIGYAYIISLDRTTPPLDKLLVGVKATAAAFSIRVRKVQVEFELNSHGARVFDSDGNPKLKDPKVLSDEKRGEQLSGGSGTPLLFGFIFDLGAGLGYAFDSGLSDSGGRPSISLTKKGGGAMDGVTCYSDHDLTAADFDGATFSFAAIKGPSVKVGNYLSLDVFSTRFHEYRLRNGKTLNAIVTSRLEPKLLMLSPPSLDLLYGGIAKIKEYIDGWTKGRASGTLFEVSQGHGWIAARLGTAPDPVPVIQPGSPAYAALQATARGLVLFDVDRASLRAGTGLLRDARAQLEVWLATVRALLTGAVREVKVTGFTSPEAPRCHNEQLSAARADTVALAILDAFENPAGRLIVSATGAGELPALAAGLSDPPDDPAALAAFTHAHRNEVARWPDWRKVELVADGDVLIIGYEATRT